MADHRIFPHSQPEPLADGVWRVVGNLGLPLHRNMIVLRLSSGELLLHSVVAMDEAGLAALEALGRPAYVIVPSIAHQLDSGFYRRRYPAAKFLAPAAVRAEVETRTPLSGTVEDVLPSLGFVVRHPPGTKVAECTYEWAMPAGGRVLIFNDLLGGDHFARDSLVGRLLIAPLGPPRHRLDLSRIYRLTSASDVGAIRRFIGTLADIPDLRLATVSHGDPATSDVAAALRRISAE